MKRLPRAPSDRTCALSGRVYNDIASAIEANSRLTVAPPLMLDDTPAGKVLRIASKPNIGIARITATAAGAGWYSGRNQVRNSTAYDQTSDLSLSSYFADASVSDDVYIQYMPESMAPAGAHSLATNGNVYVQGVWDGISTGSSGRQVLRVGDTPQGVFPVTLTQTGGTAGTNGPPPTAASYTYTVKDATATNTLGTGIAVWFNRQKGHVTAAAHGTAVYIAGTLYILTCDEVIDTTAC